MINCTVSTLAKELVLMLHHPFKEQPADDLVTAGSCWSRQSVAFVLVACPPLNELFADFEQTSAQYLAPLAARLQRQLRSDEAFADLKLDIPKGTDVLAAIEQFRGISVRLVICKVAVRLMGGVPLPAQWTTTEPIYDVELDDIVNEPVVNALRVDVPKVRKMEMAA